MIQQEQRSNRIMKNQIKELPMQDKGYNKNKYQRKIKIKELQCKIKDPMKLMIKIKQNR